jgi:hypothetical protein
MKPTEKFEAFFKTLSLDHSSYKDIMKKNDLLVEHQFREFVCMKYKKKLDEDQEN